MNHDRLLSLFAALFALLAPTVNAQLVINTGQTATDLVQNVLLGSGVTVSNVSFNGATGNAVYEQLASFNSTNANVGINSGILLTTGHASVAVGPNNNSGANAFTGQGVSDPDLVTLAGGPIFDAAVLEFDFVPSGSQVSFNFVFASEEYLEFVGQFNDVFGFFLSGPGINGPFANNAANIALVPGTSLPVSINNVNDFNNPAFYVDNGDGFTAPQSINPFFIQFDGLTVSIAAQATVQCGQTYHIKLAVGDALDPNLDSGVFLQANAFSSPSMQLIVSPNTNLPCVGTVDLSILNVTGGIAPLTFAWTQNGNPIGNGQTITVSSPGTFMASVTDGCGATVQQQVVVGPPASPPMNLQVTPNTSLPCSGNLTLEVVSLTGGTPPYTLQWTLNGNPLGNSNSITVPNTAPGTYVLTVNDDCGGSTQQQVVVGPPVSPPMVLTVTPNAALNCLESTTLSVLNVTGGTPPFTFAWTLNGVNVGNAQDLPVAAASPGTYVVTVSDDCGGSQQASVVVSVLPPANLAVAVTPPVELPCQGSVNIAVVQVNGGVPPFTHVWTLNGAVVGNGTGLTVPSGQPGQYVVTVQDACGGSGTANVLVSPPNMPLLTITPGGPFSVPCLGDQATLAATVTGGDGQYSFQWSDANGNAMGTGATLTVPVTGDATFTLQVNDNCGQQTSAPVLVQAPPPLQAVLPAFGVVCEGGSIAVEADGAGGGGAYTFLWSPSGDTTQAVTVAPTADTTITVTIFDACGDQAQASITVRVEIPVVTIQTSELGGDKFRFTAVSAPPAAQYLWSFSTGLTDLGQVVEHTFADDPLYFATVTIVTPAGCTDVDSVFLQPAAQLYFPNAFTPDGDGINDVFAPVFFDLTELELIIFDRWGAEVFSTKEIGRGWDGRFRDGSLAPTGVYVYQYRARGLRFPPTKGFGSVTLLGQNTASR